MPATPDLDTQQVHRRFSAACFNQAWTLLEKDEEMLRFAFAAMWHWTQRHDCAPTNLAFGCWQLSRIYATLRQADNARRYAQLSLYQSATDPSVCQ